MLDKSVNAWQLPDVYNDGALLLAVLACGVQYTLLW